MNVKIFNIKELKKFYPNDVSHQIQFETELFGKILKITANVSSYRDDWDGPLISNSSIVLITCEDEIVEMNGLNKNLEETIDILKESSILASNLLCLEKRISELD